MMKGSSFVFVAPLRSDAFEGRQLREDVWVGRERTNKIHHSGKWANAHLTSYIREPSKPIGSTKTLTLALINVSLSIVRLTIFPQPPTLPHSLL